MSHPASRFGLRRIALKCIPFRSRQLYIAIPRRHILRQLPSNRISLQSSAVVQPKFQQKYLSARTGQDGDFENCNYKPPTAKCYHTRLPFELRFIPEEGSNLVSGPWKPFQLFHLILFARQPATAPRRRCSCPRLTVAGLAPENAIVEILIASVFRLTAYMFVERRTC